MSTLLSTPAVAAPVLRGDGERRLSARLALWTVQFAIAGMFFFAGALKLTGAPEMVATFEAIGLGQWFRYLTGAIEGASAVMLLVPSLAAFGALLAIPTMVGAVATHLFVLGGSAVPALMLLAGSLVVAYARRRQLTRALASLF